MICFGQLKRAKSGTSPLVITDAGTTKAHDVRKLESSPIPPVTVPSSKRFIRFFNNSMTTAAHGPIARPPISEATLLKSNS